MIISKQLITIRKNLILAFIIFSLVLTPVFAQEDADNAGLITANSKTLWAFDRGWENFRLAIIFNDEKRANYLIDRANERAGEIRSAEDENVIVRVEKVRAKHLADAEIAAENLDDTKKAQVLLNIQKHIAVLERVRELVPEQARAVITRAIESSDARVIRFADKLTNSSVELTGEAKTNLEASRARVKTRGY